jgi:molybdopterin-guanine dinucleotide biosynthesis protein A
MTVPALTGLVLAGGASTRMGRDKATLEVDGVRLVDAAVSVLATVCERVLVAGGDRVIDGLAVEQIPDAPGEGPLAGIVAGLREARTPLLAVLGVDMPRASGEVLRDLASRWTSQAGVAPVVDRVLQPLHAVYATDFAENFAVLLAQGERSPRRALTRLGVLAVEDIATPADFTANLNRPRDLERPSPPRSAAPR